MIAKAPCKIVNAFEEKKNKRLMFVIILIKILLKWYASLSKEYLLNGYQHFDTSDLCARKKRILVAVFRKRSAIGRPFILVPIAPEITQLHG
jgi:hypothetical protein